MAYELRAEQRKEKNPRRLRRQGRIPGVVYGPEVHEHIVLNTQSLRRLLSQVTRSSRISLHVDGDSMDAFIKDIQYHPLTDEVLHVDFYRPPAGEPVALDVPIKLKGEAQGRKQGGIVNQFREDVTVSGPAEQIPELIELDITELGVHDSLHARDLSLAEGVELVTPPDVLLVTVLAPRKIEEVLEAETTEEAAESMAEPLGLEPEEGEEAEGETEATEGTEPEEGPEEPEEERE